MLFKLALAICVLFISEVKAASKYPVDVSYLVADLKYSQEHGIKICEIQHGILSRVTGDIFLRGTPGPISSNFCEVLSEFPIKKWTIARQIINFNITLLISKALDWQSESFFATILNNEEGSLNDCRKAYCKPPFFTDLGDAVQTQVEEGLSMMMPLLYQEMLENID